MSKYHAGRRLEYEVKELFTTNGWSSIRGAGSKGDIVCEACPQCGASIAFKTDLLFTKSSRESTSEVHMVLTQMKRHKRKG